MFRIVLIGFLCLLCFASRSQVTVYRVNLNDPSRPTAVSAMKLLEPGKLNFFTFSMYFSACLPCVNEINEIQRRLRIAGLDSVLSYNVVSSVGKESPALTALYTATKMKDQEWKFPVFVDTNFALAGALGVPNFPLDVVFGPDGKILYYTSPEKDTSISLRVQSLFDSIFKRLNLSPIVNLNNDLIAVKDIEYLTYSGGEELNKALRWNNWIELPHLFKKISPDGHLSFIQAGGKGGFSLNSFHLYTTDKKLMDRYIKAFQAAGYLRDLGSSFYDSVTNYEFSRRKIFNLETYESKTANGTVFYNMELRSPDLSSIKNYDENARASKLFRLSVKQLEAMWNKSIYDVAIQLIKLGFVPGDRKNSFVLTTNGLNGFTVRQQEGLWYSSADATAMEQLKEEFSKAGYTFESRKGKEEVYVSPDKKIKATFFYSESSKEFFVVMNGAIR